MNTTHTVYIDCDGVIACFDTKVKEITGKFVHELHRSKLWSAVNYHNSNVEPFFEFLPKTKDADILWYFISENFKNYEVLTATGSSTLGAGDQKRKWVARHFGEHVKVNIVQDSKDKAKFATPLTILVDDRSKAIDPFIAAGGLGILHTSAETSIAELQKFL